MEVSNGKALALLFGSSSNNNHHQFEKQTTTTNIANSSSSVHQFRSPPPPPYHFHTHASSSSQQGTHQLGWKGGSGQACGHMMKHPKNNNGESAITTDVLTGMYKTSDATLYNHQYHDNYVVATNAMVMAGTPNNSFDYQKHCTNTYPYYYYSGSAATCASSPWNVNHSVNNVEQHTLPPTSIINSNHFAPSSTHQYQQAAEQYYHHHPDRVATPLYCHDSVVVARPQNFSVTNAFALPPQTTTQPTNNIIQHHHHHQQYQHFTADDHHQQQQEQQIPDVCYHDESTNLDNCKCHVRIIRPTHMLANLEEQHTFNSLEPHSKKMKFDSVIETHSSSSSNASNSISESTASRKNSLDGGKHISLPSSQQQSETALARKPIIAKKSSTKKPKSDDTSQTKKKVTSCTKKTSPNSITKSNVKFNVDLSKENLQDTSTIPIRILAYNLGLTKDIQKSWRYRDIRRALFERMIDEHIDFVDNQLEHSLLRERLPHKLTYTNFCKRVMLLVFHFVVRDGKEPKFFRRPLVQRDCIEKLLKDNDPHFYSLIETSHAHKIHNLMNGDSKTFQEAITIVFKDLIDPTTLQSLHGSFHDETCRKIRKPRSQKKSCSDDEDDNVSEDEDLDKPPARSSRRRASTDLKRKLKPVSEDSDDEDDY